MKYKIVLLSNNMFCVERSDGERTKPVDYSEPLWFDNEDGVPCVAMTNYFDDMNGIYETKPMEYETLDESAK